MRLLLAFFIAAISVAICERHTRAQDATQSTVTVPSNPSDETPPEPSPSAAAIPNLPELSTLDQAFNQTGLGKDADELRTRIEMRKLQNQVEQDPAVVAAKTAAEAAATDLEKRERLREYYEISYGLMARRASTSPVRDAIVQSRKEHIALLAQPRVRPTSTEPTPGATPKKKKHKRSGKRF